MFNKLDKLSFAKIETMRTGTKAIAVKVSVHLFTMVF